MPDGPLLGVELDLEVERVAAGGSCVAREPGGRVVFVRHALPGELVRAVVTEDRGGSFCRADAVQVLRASPDRVEPPCPHAGPGRCGGCDWQHASGAAQRELKAHVIRDHFARFGGLGLDATSFAGVDELPGGLLGWRTRINYAVNRDRVGLRRHRSHEVEHIERCPLGVDGVGDAPALVDEWTGLSGVEVAAGDALTILGRTPGGPPRRGRRPPDHVRVLAGPPTLRHAALGRLFEVAAWGFWQVHPAAAQTIAAAVLDAVDPQPGERALDLYAGAGLLTAALAQAVGPDGAVLGIESNRRAVVDAAGNLRDLPWAQVRRGRLGGPATSSRDAKLWPARADIVALDPPRAGAGGAVMRRIAQLGPRAIAYVSCDPGTLARDTAMAREFGWSLARLRAFDAFPMTHHVECVALLLPSNGG